MGTLGMPITRMSNIREGLEAGCRKSRALGRLSSVLNLFWNFRVLHPELCRAVTTTVPIPTKHHEHINEVDQIYVSSQQPIYRAIGAELKSFRNLHMERQ